MNLLNPKVSLFFLAFLPQFVTTGASDPVTQMIIYGVLFQIQALVVFSMINLFAAKIGSYLRERAVVAKNFHIAQGSLFALLGVKIALSER